MLRIADNQIVFVERLTLESGKDIHEPTVMLFCLQMSAAEQFL